MFEKNSTVRQNMTGGGINTLFIMEKDEKNNNIEIRNLLLQLCFDYLTFKPPFRGNNDNSIELFVPACNINKTTDCLDYAPLK